MPQLDFSTYPSQLFWLVLSFAFLYFVLSVFVLPRLAKVQQTRLDSTAGKRLEAQQATEKAEAMLEQYEAQITESRRQAQKEAQAQRSATDKVLSQKTESTKSGLDEQLHEAEKEIASFLRNSQEQTLEAAAITAQDIIQALTQTSISQDETLQSVREVKNA